MEAGKMCSVDRILKKLVDRKVIDARNEEVIREVAKKIAFLVEEYKIPEEEAYLAIVKGLRKNTSVTYTNVSELKEDTYANIKIKVIETIPCKGKVRQRALAGDKTGKVFVVNLSEYVLQKDKCYELTNAAVTHDKERNRIAVLITKSTKVKEINEDIDVFSENFEGLVIDVVQAGFVPVCPKCKKTLKDLTCTKHGKQDSPVEKFIAKVIADNGTRTACIMLTEQTLEKAIKMTKTDLMAVDPTMQKDIIENRLLGKYIIAKGTKGDRIFFADEITVLDSSELREMTKRLIAEAAETTEAAEAAAVPENGERAPAVRVLSLELKKACEEKREQLESLPAAKIPLKGIEVSRVLLAGIVLEGRYTKNGKALIRLADYSGDIPVFADSLHALEPLDIAAVVGKPKVINGRAVVRAEKVFRIDKDTYDFLNTSAYIYAVQRGAEVVQAVEQKFR